MKRILPLLCALLPAMLFVPATLASDECRVELRNDFRVSSEFLEVSSSGTTLYKIRQGGELTIAGKPVNLTSEQRVLAQQYAGEVGALAAQWIELVSGALGVLGEGLGEAFGSAFGEDSEATVQSVRAAAVSRKKFESMSRDGDGIYNVRASEFNDLGAVMREEIEDAIKASLGALLVEVGESIKSGEGSFQERMESFGERMEVMGSELEHMGASLEETGARLCAELRALQKLERKLADEIPQLEEYPLFTP